MKFEYNFKNNCFGECNVTKEIVHVSLPPFTKGYHKNNGYKQHDKRNYTNDELIKDITHTVNHEVLHCIMHRQKTHKHLQGEYMNYYMNGSGGNGFFHTYYHIRRNNKWEKMINE